MSQMRILGVGLLVLGIVLLMFGYNASQSVGEQLTEALTGRFTDETMLYFIGGGILVVVGLLCLVRR